MKALWRDRQYLTELQGNQTLNLLAGDMYLGYGTLYNVVLTPGNNSCYFTGYVDTASLLTKIEPLLALEGPALSQGEISLSADGNSTIYNGSHIPYYEDILNNLLLNSTMPILSIIEGTLGGLLNNSAGALESIVTKLENNLNLSSLVPILDSLSKLNLTLKE